MLPVIRLATIVLSSALAAAGSGTDFSGKWLLDRDGSDSHALPAEPYPSLAVEQNATMHCTAAAPGGQPVQWTYLLDGGDSRYRIAGESLNSVAKWEGAALLINTLVSGGRDYAIMDRWTLSHDGNQLNIQRQVVQGTAMTEGRLTYRREDALVGQPAASNAAPGAPPAQQPALVRRAEPQPPPVQFVVPAGTHILLTLTNPISTRNSREGDHVYLETAVPVARDGQIVIPKGSYVQGAITKTKPAGRMDSKSELYIRFESLTLPNGVSRDFRARLTSADPARGKVDPDEGKITGDKGKDSGKVARDVGLGGMGGVIVGGAAGHPVTGLGAGAAAGLAAVLLSRNKDVVLPRGTSVEMVLDRDLYYTAAELRH